MSQRALQLEFAIDKASPINDGHNGCQRESGTKAWISNPFNSQHAKMRAKSCIPGIGTSSFRARDARAVTREEFLLQLMEMPDFKNRAESCLTRNMFEAEFGEVAKDRLRLGGFGWLVAVLVVV